MHPALFRSTTIRILRQLLDDRRTVAMILIVPCVLMVLLYFMFDSQPGPRPGTTMFDKVGLIMLGLLPFVLMFITTSIAMVRERTSGTLERLLTTPLGKLDLLAGYGAAFSLAAAVQAALASALAFWMLDLDIAGNPLWVVLIAVLAAVLGVALGLFFSAFARTEFQAVQFIPVVVIPQLLLCGLFVARDQMTNWLQWISDVLPLTYVVDALQQVAEHSDATGTMWRDLVVVAAFSVVALGLGAATLRRVTP
ncbi:MAG: antibiotic ABC transporter permease [Gordonia sp.]|uniref:ABC transporter permease n=1 Tax=Williamsia sp. 1138 TaxID=1903117 RepID=UPI000A0FC92D|nr:ABC transporter permease [Williamsia sp. 1138]MBA4023985.1 antibiotic ABC transporter permease [Gordonia sp. (in: high G+C Gram-positive bacteria)]OZG29487.1 antibiotic ABC transporter permease [Williamsia sp. 1138]